jgi:hypothetical protein
MCGQINRYWITDWYLENDLSLEYLLPGVLLGPCVWMFNLNRRHRHNFVELEEKLCKITAERVLVFKRKKTSQKSWEDSAAGKLRRSCSSLAFSSPRARVSMCAADLATVLIRSGRHRTAGSYQRKRRLTQQWISYFGLSADRYLRSSAGRRSSIELTMHLYPPHHTHTHTHK